MIKTLLSLTIIGILISCSTTRITEYVKYESKVFNTFSSLELELIDFKLANQDGIKKGYASLYICKVYKSDKIVKIVSTCTNVKFKKQTYLRLYECRKELKDTICVASDRDLETKYNNVPIFFGKIAIPME